LNELWPGLKKALSSEKSGTNPEEATGNSIYNIVPHVMIIIILVDSVTTKP
jgi:hypothetical protein